MNLLANWFPKTLQKRYYFITINYQPSTTNIFPLFIAKNNNIFSYLTICETNGVNNEQN